MVCSQHSMVCVRTNLANGSVVLGSGRNICRIHQVHVARVLACFAPYHATAEFARLVQISVIGGTVFQFLEGTKQTGAVIPRTAIVKRCLKDHVRHPFRAAVTLR